jgi:uncharacterized membrane protein
MMLIYFTLRQTNESAKPRERLSLPKREVEIEATQSRKKQRRSQDEFKKQEDDKDGELEVGDKNKFIGSVIGRKRRQRKGKAGH